MGNNAANDVHTRSLQSEGLGFIPLATRVRSRNSLSRCSLMKATLCLTRLQAPIRRERLAELLQRRWIAFESVEDIPSGQQVPIF